MADLLTHGAVAWLLGTALVRREERPLLVTGTLLPDLLSRVPGILATGLAMRWEGMPEVLRLGWEPLHMPVGMVLASAALAVCFEPGTQRRALGLLLGGMLLHLAVDLLQAHMGAGYLLAFPLSHAHWELGLVGSEDSVLLAPVLLGLVVLQALRERRGARQGESLSSED